MTQYIIYEVQNRADGINNVVEPVVRNTFPSGLSFFYDRCSKMSATTLYPTVNILLRDTDGNTYKDEHIVTAYEKSSNE